MSSNTVSDNDNSSPALDFARNACTYLTQATDPFHAVFYACERLKGAGFVDITDSSSNESTNQFVLQPGGKYYYVVHSTTLVAFCVGIDYQPDGTCGFHVVGGHTDSPNISIKPNSKKPTKCDVTQLAVQCYGGGLWHTWFDRDLSISGQVLIKEEQQNSTNYEPDENNNYHIVSKLVKIKDPIARISTLCIHLQSDQERKAFQVNKEDHTSPIIGGTEQNANQKVLEEKVSEQINQNNKRKVNNDQAWTNHQEPMLLNRIAKECMVDNIHNIVDYQLNLYDTQPASIGGMNHEFIYSARLDNLATVFCATESLIQHADTTIQMKHKDISMMVCFDHEEVGSTSLNGAGSPVIQYAFRRITASLFNQQQNNIKKVLSYEEFYINTINQSFCISMDQAHAIHPNYSSKHDIQHSPTMNSGVVIKSNCNQRYATNRNTAYYIREIGNRTNVPIQEFVVKNDCPCGSTIGPIISNLIGIRTVDIGMSQLSMHSCREVMGVQDLYYGYQLLVGYYQYFRSIDDTMKV